MQLLQGHIWLQGHGSHIFSHFINQVNAENDTVFKCLGWKIMEVNINLHVLHAGLYRPTLAQFLPPFLKRPVFIR